MWPFQMMLQIRYLFDMKQFFSKYCPIPFKCDYYKADNSIACIPQNLRFYLLAKKNIFNIETRINSVQNIVDGNNIKKRLRSWQDFSRD